jgi:hypothetical protein
MTMQTIGHTRASLRAQVVFWHIHVIESINSILNKFRLVTMHKVSQFLSRARGAV